MGKWLSDLKAIIFEVGDYLLKEFKRIKAATAKNLEESFNEVRISRWRSGSTCRILTVARDRVLDILTTIRDNPEEYAADFKKEKERHTSCCVFPETEEVYIRDLESLLNELDKVIEQISQIPKPNRSSVAWKIRELVDSKKEPKKKGFKYHEIAGLTLEGKPKEDKPKEAKPKEDKPKEDVSV